MSLKHRPPQNQQSRFSRQGFEPLGGPRSSGMQSGDATIEIPLQKVPSYTGARHDGTVMDASDTYSGEKNGGFGRDGKRKPRRVNTNGEPTGQIGSDGEEDYLTKMGMVYRKIKDFSIITRYLLYIIPLGAVISVPIIVGATAAQDATVGGVRIVWFFTWVLVVWVSLWASKIVAKALPFLFQFLAGFVSAGTRKYAQVIRALEVPLSICGWILTSLATFAPLMTRNPTARSVLADDPGADVWPHWMDILNRILAALMIASLINLAEKTIVQLISINYHRKQFNAKIKASKRSIHLLTLLYEASRSLFPIYCNEFAEEDYAIADIMNMKLAGKKRSRPLSGTMTPMKVVQDFGRFGEKVTGVLGDVAHEITGREMLNPNSPRAVVITALERKRSSEALARRLWMSFVVEGRESLYEEDLVEVLGPDHRADAEEAFAALDKDGNGDVSLDEMILATTELGRDRQSIATSMTDIDSAIHVLDRLLSTVAFIISVFVIVAFLNASFVTTLATAGTALLSLSFIFAGTAQELLGSCIFLFVKHPYDVGDRVDIEKEQYTVEHISLLFTVFHKIPSNKMVQVPNQVLNSLFVENVSRSRHMKEQLTLYIAFDTSFEDIQALRDEMRVFVTNKENSRDFYPDFEVEVTGINEMSKLELTVEIKHKSNWANETVRAARRSKFMCALVLALRRVPIYPPGGGGAPTGAPENPAYNVSVSDEFAWKARRDFAAAQEVQRLVSTKKPSNSKDTDPVGTSTATDYQQSFFGAPDLGPIREQRAVETLHTRSPAADPARDEIWGTYRGDQQSTSDDDRHPSASSMDRTGSIEEVRGLLHRESTRGRRKAGVTGSGTNYPIPVVAEEEQAYDGQGEYATRADSIQRSPPRQPRAGNALAQRQPGHEQQERGGGRGSSTHHHVQWRRCEEDAGLHDATMTLAPFSGQKRLTPSEKNPSTLPSSERGTIGLAEASPGKKAK